MSYSHRQRAPAISAFFCGLMVGLGIAAVSLLAIRGIPARIPLSILFLAALMGLTAVAFNSLTVAVADEQIILRFGPGWISKRIPIAEIARVSEVQNPRLYGFGIHYIGNGWIYNIAGPDGVELILKTGARLRIGTDEPARLAEAIRHAAHL
jgi:hypothetical protein